LETDLIHVDTIMEPMDARKTLENIWVDPGPELFRFSCPGEEDHTRRSQGALLEYRGFRLNVGQPDQLLDADCVFERRCAVRNENLQAKDAVNDPGQSKRIFCIMREY
jgi:hypothetical protein